jgi:hypothetical protein
MERDGKRDEVDLRVGAPKMEDADAWRCGGEQLRLNLGGAASDQNPLKQTGIPHLRHPPLSNFRG